MRANQVLDFRGIAVEAADDEHFLEPAGDTQVSGGVEAADVACMQPPRVVDGLACGGLVVEVPTHDVVAADPHFARLTCGDVVSFSVYAANLHAGERTPTRVGDSLQRVAEPADRRQAAALGQSVSSEHDVKTEHLAHAPDQLWRDRRRPRDRHAQR
ncbi:hypothetical protein D3C72_1474930 [compost metagenome]